MAKIVIDELMLSEPRLLVPKKTPITCVICPSALFAVACNGKEQGELIDQAKYSVSDNGVCLNAVDGTTSGLVRNDGMNVVAGLTVGSISLRFKTAKTTSFLFSIANTTVSNTYATFGVGSLTGIYADESVTFAMFQGGATAVLAMYTREGHTKYTDNTWHTVTVIVDGVANRFIMDGRSPTMTFQYGSGTTKAFTNIGVAPDSLDIGRRNINAGGTPTAGLGVEVDCVVIRRNPMTTDEAIAYHLDPWANWIPA